MGGEDDGQYGLGPGCGKNVGKGDARYYWIPNIVLPQLLLFLMSFIPCFLMVYFGTDYLKSAIQFLGENIVGVLTTIGGMLPAVGIALTLKSIFKASLWCSFSSDSCWSSILGWI